jgi:hypothetical protein
MLYLCLLKHDEMGIKFLLWALLCYGITNIIVFGSIFENFREFFNKWGVKSPIGRFIHELITCPMCFATWFGFVFGAFIYSPMANILEVKPIYSWIFDGFLASGCVWIINTCVEFLEENRIK